MFSKKISFPFLKTHVLINKISAIDSFNGKWHAVEERENRYLRELKRIATIESCGASTRIEGTRLTDKEIEKLLSNIKISKLITKDEKEVIEYYQALKLILDNYKTISITEDFIRQLHSILLKQSKKNQKYREETAEVSFDTTEPHLINTKILELINWINDQLKKQNIHPLFIIATFIYELLSIHPFQDGNGRLSRLLTTLLMMKNGYDFVQYISYEHIIEKNNKKYYRSLMSGQKNRNKEEENIYEWILFFLTSIEKLTLKLEVKCKKNNNKQCYLNSRQNELIQLLKKFQPLKISDIDVKMDIYSINTLKKDIQYLQSEKIIEKIGKGRGTIYFINDKST